MPKPKKKSRAPVAIDTQDITRRALAAWFRGGGTEQPAEDSGHIRHKKLDYVVLVNVKGDVLAVYRLRNDGMLKRLKRWPEDLVK